MAKPFRGSLFLQPARTGCAFGGVGSIHVHSSGWRRQFYGKH